MKKYLITILDDDADDCEILATALKENYDNLQVLTFTDSKDYLQFLSLAPNMPDLLVTDMYMPLMTGIEVAEWMKNNPATSQIPVFILSITKNEGLAIEAASLGIVQYFVKPVELIEYSVLADKIMQKV